MQCLTGEPVRRFCRSVGIIAKERMTDTCHMYAYLMCSPGFKLTFNMGKMLEIFEIAVMCHCASAILLVNCHFFTVNRISANRRINSSGFFPESVVADCFVFTGNGMNAQLFGNFTVGIVIFAGN